MTKIAVIENQYTHFTSIHRHLENAGFEVYPPDNDGDTAVPFRTFIDLVRIFLNERFGGLTPNSIRAAAFERLIGILIAEDPALIIIDYVLVGNHDSHKGTFLAAKLRERGLTTPIIFLSRTEPHDLETRTSYQKVSGPKDWVHKGYAGRRILEEGYFAAEVLTKMSEMTREADFDGYAGKLKLLRELGSIRNSAEKTEIFDAINKIANSRSLTEVQMLAIDTFIGSQKQQTDIRALLEAIR